ncbi:TPA: hypothetical protein ACGBUC_005498 [Klebsiella variicola]|uniref:hypothetical protein n=1 Tax=Klebsiella TaxID=570 RepID=UPI000D743612|nr:MULTISPECIES: hypothetical protein [Klebsiella]ELB6488206.1 hypothetical protein [Raoultella ornithinolytica]MCS5775179.1 hypothetical protein [Klebsiella variicola subsp. variicola]MCI8031993.1 hypothetical protein [Klebsiella pneumoniae]MCS5930341.1 hypothetical protein [Klebsiella pneumoniae subsp. pneumoniae]MCS6055390.1 hypothetical protein [Klebsiella variicola subsp. variicola]
MTYAIFLLVTAVCAFGLNYLTNKICPAMVVINKSGGSNVHALRCITSFLLLLVTLWLPVKPAVINLAVEFAALVNFIASVTLYTVANLREKRRVKKKKRRKSS